MLDKRERKKERKREKEKGRKKRERKRLLYIIPKLGMAKTCYFLPEAILGPAYWLPGLRKLWMFIQPWEWGQGEGKMW